MRIFRRKKFVIFQISFFYFMFDKNSWYFEFYPTKKFMEFEIKEFMKKKYFIFIFSLCFHIQLFYFSIFIFGKRSNEIKRFYTILDNLKNYILIRNNQFDY